MQGDHSYYQSEDVRYQKVQEDMIGFCGVKNHQGFHPSSGNQYKVSRKVLRHSVILQGSHLVFPFAHKLLCGSSKHLHLVALNGVIDRLSSFY